MSELEQRIAKLERQVWTWQRCGLAAMGLLVCLAVVAAGPQDAQHDELQTGTLTVGRPEGARIRMTTQADGAYLILYDEHGRQRWRVAAKGDTPYWLLYDAQGRVVRRWP